MASAPASAHFAAEASTTTGAARRARERKKRALSKHVMWITDLCQAGSAHHTAARREAVQACPGCLALCHRLDALEQQPAVDLSGAELSAGGEDLESAPMRQSEPRVLDTVPDDAVPAGFVASRIAAFQTVPVRPAELDTAVVAAAGLVRVSEHGPAPCDVSGPWLMHFGAGDADHEPLRFDIP